MSRKFIYIILVCLTLGIGSFSFSDPGQRYFEIAKNLDIFASLFKEVNALYVDEVNPNQLIQTGINAMLSSLDPYTNYIPEDQIENFRTQSTGQYGGIGAVTGYYGDKIKVIMVYEGFSAFNNGLRIGDEIIKINNIDVKTLTPEESNELMKGQLGTSLSLTVKRYGVPEPVEINFVREKVTIESVPYFGIISDGIGYVKLNEFTMQAGRDIREAVAKLKNDGASKIILDLRGNPGGLLMEAVNISNIFLPKGVPVVETKGKVEDNNMTYSTLNQPLDTEIPVAVLINGTSASASEIVAGTFQDYDRGVIVGQKSFGKGLVQISRELSYNSHVKITTAKYYTPSGRCIQSIDYSHKNEDGSADKVPDSLINEFRTKNGRIVFDGGGIDPDITTERIEMMPVSYALLKNGYIFDYASKYRFENEKIAEPKDFKLTDQDFKEFIHWLGDKELTYDTRVEQNLKTLVAQAKKEQYYNAIKNDLEVLKSEISHSKANDLQENKSQILTLLEEEIASRYYYQRGSIESVFDEDPDITEAIKVLNDETRYKKLLNIQ